MIAKLTHGLYLRATRRARHFGCPDNKVGG
jgi:hypothetical protein